MSSPYSYSDSVLLQKIVDIASENATNTNWPNRLKPDIIRAEAEKTYSLWNRIWIALANYSHVQNRDGHYEHTYTENLGPGGSRSDTKYVLDRFDNTPGPYKTNYRAFLEKTYIEVSRLQNNFRDNSLGWSPERLNRMRAIIQESAKELRRCCGLCFYYEKYIVPMFNKFLW